MSHVQHGTESENANMGTPSPHPAGVPQALPGPEGSQGPRLEHAPVRGRRSRPQDRRNGGQLLLPGRHDPLTPVLWTLQRVPGIPPGARLPV